MQVRFRSNFAYVDDRLPDGEVVKLCRLRYVGDADRDVHLVRDNYATHKTPEIRRRLIRHSRFHLHYVPTGSSWLNIVEPGWRG